MLTDVVRFVTDPHENYHLVQLRDGRTFEGWEACRAIEWRNKVQGNFQSPLILYMDKRDVKKLEERKRKKV